MRVLEVSEEMVLDIIPPRRKSSRKGENGRILVVGGSYLYHGAPIFSALAAYRSGVDVAYVAVPRQIVSSIRAYSPSLIVFPLPDVKLTSGSVNRILRGLERRTIRADSAVVGPGLGRGRVKEIGILAYRLADMGLKIVLDADSLRREVVEKLVGQRVVITPHDGEFSRMFGEGPGESLEERIESVGDVSNRLKVVVLLKGPIDVISDGERMAINRTGNAGMTVGGTGDVLSGLVAGLMAKGVEPFRAASAAAYINGSAGDGSAGKYGFHFTAEDLLDEIPLVMKKFDRSD